MDHWCCAESLDFLSHKFLLFLQWIALSIVKPLADEITSINSILSRKGVSEQIGSTFIRASISYFPRNTACFVVMHSHVHQLPEALGQILQVPAPPHPLSGHPLPGGVPKAGVPGGQDQRLINWKPTQFVSTCLFVCCVVLFCFFEAELAQGSYLSAYRWNSGGNWKGRMWSIDLPNDSQVRLISSYHPSLPAQIVMHLLSTYLDTHLPPDPWFPDGKTFSTQYFLKAPPKNGVCVCVCVRLCCVSCL